MAEIRQILPSEVESFRQCLNAVIAEQRWLGTTEPWPKGVIDKGVLDRLAVNAPNIIAIQNGEMIGWCDITPGRGTKAHVGHLGMGVRKDFRGQGIGSRLLEAALAGASACGLWRVELEVYETNPAAIALYEKHAFIREGVKRKGALIKGNYVDVISMARLE